jgi:hypothetical protein
MLILISYYDLLMLLSLHLRILELLLLLFQPSLLIWIHMMILIRKHSVIVLFRALPQRNLVHLVLESHMLLRGLSTLGLLLTNTTLNIDNSIVQLIEVDELTQADLALFRDLRLH